MSSSLICQGIFRPRQMSRGVLSAKTTVALAGAGARYDDIASEDGFSNIGSGERTRGHGDNRRLLEAFEDRSPVIYFHGVAPGVYKANWAVFVTAWDAATLSVKIIPGQAEGGGMILPESRTPGATPWSKPSDGCTRPYSGNSCSTPIPDIVRSAALPLFNWSLLNMRGSGLFSVID